MGIPINRLSSMNQEDISSSDLLALYVSANNDTRKISLNQLKEFIGTSVIPSYMITQYAVPATNGTIVSITQNVNDVWLIITPTATAITIKLPESPTDQQEINVNSTAAISTLTIDANGKNSVGLPSSLTQNGYFTARYDAVSENWYRVA